MHIPHEFILFAQNLASRGRPIIKQYFRQKFDIDDKADLSPVTIADRLIEQTLRWQIHQQYPSHGILGEENGGENLDAEWVWVIDPIDGTAAFVTGKPSFGTLIALLHQGRPCLGLIDQAITDEQWLGVIGHATTLNNQIIHTRDDRNLNQAYLYTTDPTYFDETSQPGWDNIKNKVKQVRYGADCYAYALLATGSVDLVTEAMLKPYDFLCLPPIIQGAGGVVTDWQGAALNLNSDGTVVAAGSKHLHQQALQVLLA